MSERLRKLIMAGSGLSASSFQYNAPDGEPLSVIELEGNLADAEKPPELRSGRYTAEIQGVEVKTSGNSGNRYYAIKCMIPPEELPADLREDYEEGAVMYWNRQLVPEGAKADRRTLFNLRQFIEKLGLDSNTTTIDPNDWMGRRLTLVVGQSAYNGEMRAQINAVESAEAEQAAPARGSRGKAPVAEEDAGDRAAARGRGKTTAAAGRARR